MVSIPAMRILIFCSGLAILGLGGAALAMYEKNTAMGLFQGSLTLGGAILICGLFSIRMYWHGLIGAGILALLGAARGLGNLPGLMKFLSGDRSRESAPLLEFGVMVISLVLLMRVLRALSRERLRRMLAAEK